MRSRFARELRRLADRIEYQDRSSARRMGIPVGAYTLFSRVARVADISAVLDIGANTGQFARWAAAYFPGKPIHCFEPLADCVAALNRVAASHSNIVVHPFALGEHNGTHQMQRNDYSPSSSLLNMTDRHRELWPHTKTDRPIEIEVRRLDELNERFSAPLFLKFDVQGYELHALRGAQQVLKKAAVLQLEVLFDRLYEGQSDFLTLMNFLSGHGFSFVDFADERRVGPNRDLVYADAVFVADAYRKKPSK